jgi:hypothetical protein
VVFMAAQACDSGARAAAQQIETVTVFLGVPPYATLIRRADRFEVQLQVTQNPFARYPNHAWLTAYVDHVLKATVSSSYPNVTALSQALRTIDYDAREHALEPWGLDGDEEPSAAAAAATAALAIKSSEDRCAALEKAAAALREGRAARRTMSAKMAGTEVDNAAAIKKPSLLSNSCHFSQPR